MITTGVDRSLNVPSPSCPYWFHPQQRTLPAARCAQAWRQPVAIFTASPIPTTAAGVERLVCVPSPSCPCPLYPQQDTAPVAWTAQVKSPPPPLIDVRT